MQKIDLKKQFLLQQRLDGKNILNWKCFNDEKLMIPKNLLFLKMIEETGNNQSVLKSLLNRKYANMARNRQLQTGI